MDGVSTIGIGTIEKLIDHIGAGSPDSSISGDQVLVSLVWEPDGRVIEARYCKDDFADADIDVEAHVIVDDYLIRPHAKALLDSKKPIRVLTGTGDMVCFLKWTIRPAAA